MSKDIWKASKLKSCVVLSAWMVSITNQMWWAFGDSIGKKLSRLIDQSHYEMHRSSGNEEMLREKLLSIPLHLCNQHQFENNVYHVACPHGDLGDRPWLEKGSLVGKCA